MSPEPLEHDLEPLHTGRRASRARQFMRPPGEPDELDLPTEVPQHREQLLALADRTAQVLLGVQDHSGVVICVA